MLEIIKSIFFFFVLGITEWLPISSTGHMILLNELVKLDVSKDFYDMFQVVIQLGAIMAVVVIFWKQIFPFKKEDNKIKVDNNIMSLWGKILVACVPAAIIGVLFDEFFEKLFYNYVCVALALIIFGILFIIIENKNKGKNSKINSLAELSYNTVLLIGIFQLIAAIFPGTSRSGATIVGALLLGVSRTVAAEFTFFLAIPVMFGASLLKLIKFSFAFSGMELAILLVGMIVAFITSMFIIKFLMGYIKKHDFKVFGYYRIVLGIIVLMYAFFQTL